MKTTYSSLEPLEPRIAPAALNAAGNILTYTDIDGDAVKVTFTHATMAPGDFTFSTGDVAGSTGPQALFSVDLSGKTGGGFTLTAKPQKIAGQLMGDGHANIHVISSGGATDLGSISVDGDVALLSAGSGTPGTVGLKSFTALSMGRGFASFGTNDALRNVGSFTIKTDVVNTDLVFTGGVKSLSIGGNLAETFAGGKAEVDVTGNVGTIKIGGSLAEISSTFPSLHVTGDVGALAIGGSLVGGDTMITNSFQVNISGNVKTLTVGGDLIGGAGTNTGYIGIGGTVGSAKIGGTIRGGGGNASGGLKIGANVTSVSIGGSLVGGTSGSTGELFLDGGAGTIKIAGSILGGPASASGRLFVADDVRSISIGHDLHGIDYAGGGALTEEASIYCNGNIGSLALGGDFIAGHNSGAGSLKGSGIIAAKGTIGTVKIGGSIHGDPGHLAYITAGAAGGGAVKAIASITVKGSVESASLLAGYGPVLLGQNTDAGIGIVSIGGNLAGSHIIVGSDSGSDHIPGNSDDNAISTVATIGSVKIGGTFTGLASSATRFFIYGPIVNKVTIGHATYLHADLDNGGVSFEAIGLATAWSVN